MDDFAIGDVQDDRATSLQAIDPLGICPGRQVPGKVAAVGVTIGLAEALADGFGREWPGALGRAEESPEGCGIMLPDHRILRQAQGKVRGRDQADDNGQRRDHDLPPLDQL